jgi:hypothetical protein
MKLSEFAATLPAGGRAPLVFFENIGAWIFGERYQIITGTKEPGRFDMTDVFEFQDVATPLNILEAEFAPRSDVVPEMIVTNSRDIDRILKLPTGTSMQDVANNGLGMSGRADDKVLVVRATLAHPAFPRPPLEAYVDMLRSQITMYNLTQSWDQMEQRAP